MKKTISLLALGALCLTVQAQKKFSFKMGDDYELPRKAEDLSFFGNSTEGIVNLALKKDELHIVSFDAKSLQLKDDKTIELKEASRNFNSEDVIDFGTNHYWLHSDWDKDNEKEQLYYDKIEMASGKISVTNKLLLEATKIAGQWSRASSFSRIKTVGKYQFNFDAEKSKLLVSYRLVPEEKNDKLNYDKIGLFVFDEHMNKLWGREYTMPYTEAIMDNSDFSVDAAGNAYLLAKVYDNEKRREIDKETGLPGYHYEVMKFTKDSKTILKAPVKVGEYFVKNASLVENSLHEMVITSTYSKKPKSFTTDGVFLAIMDGSGKVSNYRNGYYEFPLEELTKFEKARTRRKMERKDDYEASALSVRNLVVGGDGSILVSLEEYWVDVITTYNGNYGTTTTYVYHYEDIIAAKINASGKMDWVRKIPKRQRGGIPLNTMSFKLIADESGYYFLYLDNIKNMDLPEDEVPSYHVDGAGGQVVVSKIDKAGNVSKELLFDTRDEDVMIFPTRFSSFGGNQFVGRARVKRNLFRPLVITVNK